MTKKTSLPWQEFMALGFGGLKLPPEHFWQMTLRELQSAIEGIYGHQTTAPMTKEALRGLMQQYPDSPKPTK